MARRSNQSILKEISPEYSVEGLMRKLKLQYFGHLMRRTGSFEKTLMLGKIESWRRRGRQRMRWLDGITDSMHLMRRADSLEKTLMLGKIESWGRRGRQRMRWLDVRYHFPHLQNGNNNKGIYYYTNSNAPLSMLYFTL